ncbi:vacuolar protein sorting-associated protein [Anaeramoeba ignava]|uniref:Vacuolar protein sorting-associated protein n=1 Tax=Anaeramoeba ignava TaxID=1746090 RepID=A0A9Q0L8Q8_ANAIG|nr:vacuolar protein sorting-associated protein [Anaeramoeba ignava]
MKNSLNIDETSEQPLLNYTELKKINEIIVGTNKVSCFKAHEKFLAIGTYDGYIYIFDFLGNKIKEFKSYEASVNDISFDFKGDYIGSCSVDGNVVINGINTDKSQQYTFPQVIKSIAIDPEYGVKKSQSFIYGGVSGNIVLRSKGFFKTNDLLIHSNEGTIYSINWTNQYVTWSNNNGIYVYDIINSKIIHNILRPLNSPRPDGFRCFFKWKGSKLAIAWGNFLSICELKKDLYKNENTPSKMSAIYYQIFDFFICGISFFDSNLLLLTMEDDELLLELDGTKTTQKKLKKSKSENQSNLRSETETDNLTQTETETDIEPPQKTQENTNNENINNENINNENNNNENNNEEKEIIDEKKIIVDEKKQIKSNEGLIIRLINLEGNEIATEKCQIRLRSKPNPLEYHLENNENEKKLFFSSSQQVLSAQKLSVDNKISWLVKVSKFKSAITLAKENPKELKAYTYQDLGEKHLNHLFQNQLFSEAINDCSWVCEKEEGLWAKWIQKFIENDKLDDIISKIPIKTPKLDPKTYQSILNYYLQKDIEKMNELIEDWPINLYDTQVLIQFIQENIHKQETKENQENYLITLANLYSKTDKHEQALDIFLKIKKGDVFGLINEHNLFDSIVDKVQQLIEFSVEETIDLLVKNNDRLPIDKIVPQLKHDAKLLHLYLDGIFEEDPLISRKYHGLQLNLYVQFAPEKMMNFLKSSTSIPLEKALEVCRENHLIREMVFIMKRMGNAKQTLDIIIKELKDIKQAIEFVQEEGDKDLWNDLIKYCLTNPNYLSDLLDHTLSTKFDILQVVRRIPPKMQIPHLQNKLTAILDDFKLQVQLREVTKDIIEKDCTDLMFVFYKQSRRGRRVTSSQHCYLCGESILNQPHQNSIVFNCGHAYHKSCLSDTLNIKTDDVDNRQIIQKEISR